jgi:hypothetical protein
MNARELRSSAANVGGEDLLREGSPMAIGAEDADGESDFFSWLPTLTHDFDDILPDAVEKGPLLRRNSNAGSLALPSSQRDMLVGED